MALTPEDVSNKRFTTVRLREGYDMTEVDQFLDEVEAELERLTREADELRAKLHSAQTGEPMPEPAPRVTSAGPEPEKTPEPAAPAATDTASEPALQTDQAAPGASVEALQVTTTAEASVAATRLLELAGNNADALVSEARQQAEHIVGEAKQRAESLEVETEERRKTLLGDLEREKTGMDAEIERLRTFEREYRAELRSYFEQQLSALDGQGPRGELAHAGQARTDEEHAPHRDGTQEDGNQGSGLQAVMNDDSQGS